MLSKSSDGHENGRHRVLSSKKLFDLPHAFCLHSRESFESASGHPSSPMLPNIQVLTLTDSDTPHVLEHGDQLFHEAQRAHGNPPHG